MANYTKLAIMQTFEAMLVEMPFDKITVTALVSRCEISSNTFYYHFSDIYDLLECCLIDKQVLLLRNADPNDNWEACVKIILNYMKDNSKIVNHIFDSISRERLERYIFNSVEDIFYIFVQNRAEGRDVSDEALKYISQFCCYSLLGFIIKFIWGHMTADIDSSVDSLGVIFDGTVEFMISKAISENASGLPESGAK